MAVGPVDVYIIGFPGNRFTGRIAPAIMDLVDNGTIRVLVDPMALDPAGTTTLDAWSPSVEGDRLAYQVSTGG